MSAVKGLLTKERYKEAAAMLDDMLKKEKENSELWYLRSVVCLKTRSYESALEYLERALILSEKSQYHTMRGMVFFETFDFENAIESFKRAVVLDGTDINAAFLAALSYMMLDRPESSHYLNIALRINPKKAKTMLMNSYGLLIKNDPRISQETKKKIEYEMENL